MKAWLKTIAINVFIIGALISLANFASITVNRVEAELDNKPSARINLPNYAGEDWAPVHFREISELDTEYRSFYGWRRLPFAGETINIDDHGIRQTTQASSGAPARSIAFFGGSTMWGSGVADEHTIPSLFAKLNPDYLAQNFGESAHTAHQNFNVLMEQMITDKQPDAVVFYNGVNEVSQCRSELRPYAHVREQQIKGMLDTRTNNFHDPNSYLSMFFPVQQIAKRLAASMSHRLGERPKPFNCDLNPKKAEAVARLLLWDWTAAKRLVEGYGGHFMAVLQPVAYFSRTKTDHISIEANRAAQYEAVYPLILKLLETEFAHLMDNFLDLRAVLDHDDYIYIDFCHVSGNGNELIAEAISQHFNSQTVAHAKPGYPTTDRVTR